MTMTRLQYFRYQKLRIGYRTWGDRSKPPLVLLHGFTGTSLGWKSLADVWTSHFWVVAPDLPGHGASKAPPVPEELSVAKTAEALTHLMSFLSAQPWLLLGYSFGGRIACHMMRNTPVELQCVVLESASPGIDDPKERALRRQQDMVLADKIEAHGLDWFIRYWRSLPLFASQATLSEPRRQSLENERRAHSAWGLAQSLRGAGTGTQESLWPALSTIKVPVLMVTGAEDTKYRHIARAMHEALPESQWVSVNGAGHNVHLEKPDQFDQIVSRFFSEQNYL